MLLASNGVWAYSFSALNNGVRIYYNITSNTVPYTVEVTYATSDYDTYSGSVVIPSFVSYNGRTYSVTSIGGNSFRVCSSLTSATIPNSVTSIGQYAFSGCGSLTSVTIPNSVTSIGQYAFLYLPNLNYSGNAAGSPWGALCVNGFYADSLYYIDSTKTTLCSAHRQIHSTVIPNSVTCIGDRAFYKCTGLTSVTIGNSVTSIGKYAFQYTGLTSVIIGNSVTSIGKYAFEACTGLTSLIIPNSVDTIGEYAFSDCIGLDTLVFNADSCTFEGWRTFNNCVNITTLQVGNNVKIIPSYAFNSLVGLTYLTLGDSLQYIGKQAFQNCSHLPSVSIPNLVTYLDEGAFSSCSELYSVSVGKRVGVIRPQTFADCTWLTNVTIGEGVTMIDQNAFANCNRISTLTMKPTTPPLIYSQSLSTLGDSIDIYVPCNAIQAYRSAPHWGRFVNYHGDFVNEITCTPNNAAWGSVNILEQPTCANGGVARIQAVPNAGYTFARWSDGNTQNPRTLTVTQDTVLIAYFASNQSIAEAEKDNVSIRTANGHILLEGINGEQAYVTDVLGRVVYNATVNERAEIAVKNQGIYFVKIGSRPAQKVVVAR